MSRATHMEPCWTCEGTNVQMVQLDSGHWLGTCVECGEESSIHWSRPAARRMWNADAKYQQAKRAGRDAVGPKP